MNDLILFEVKSPAESKGEWDLYKPTKRIPASEAYRPLENSECPLLNDM
jgi:branched-chain amino acid transport system substrate-binding protein